MMSATNEDWLRPRCTCGGECHDEIDRLAAWFVENSPWSISEGSAVDNAIRLLERARGAPVVPPLTFMPGMGA